MGNIACLDDPSTRNLVWSALIPERGVTFVGQHGEANSIASVLVAPGDGLGRYHRKLAEAYPLVHGVVRADPGDATPAPSPDAYHKSTIKWLLGGADVIALWSAPWSDLAERKRFDIWVTETLGATARWLTALEVTAANAAEWLRLAERRKRKAATIHVFGPVGSATVAGFSS